MKLDNKSIERAIEKKEKIKKRVKKPKNMYDLMHEMRDNLINQTKPDRDEDRYYISNDDRAKMNFYCSGGSRNWVLIVNTGLDEISGQGERCLRMKEHYGTQEFLDWRYSNRDEGDTE